MRVEWDGAEETKPTVPNMASTLKQRNSFSTIHAASLSLSGSLTAKKDGTQSAPLRRSLYWW
jgi:hypothetical protein